MYVIMNLILDSCKKNSHHFKRSIIDFRLKNILIQTKNCQSNYHDYEHTSFEDLKDLSSKSIVHLEPPR